MSDHGSSQVPEANAGTGIGSPTCSVVPSADTGCEIEATVHPPVGNLHQVQADRSGDWRAAGVTCGWDPADRDGGLDRLGRQYPRWRIWLGHTTGGYWALPPRDHPTHRGLIGASDLNELARRLAQTEGRHDL